jgi:lipoyl(octanoyl) transferase
MTTLAPSPATRLRRDDGRAALWMRSSGLVDYAFALATMQDRAAAIAAGEADELVWLLEHPPLYTAGVSARREDLVDPDRFPVFDAGRGGQYTYHGPGQRVAYVMLDLRRRGQDVRAFVGALEAWLIEALARLGVEAHLAPGRIGVWVRHGAPPREEKIAAIGVKLKRWVSLHGVSLNVAPDLTHFDGIVPCGVRTHGVTSLAALGLAVGMDEVDAALKSAFVQVFGPAAPCA